MSLYGKYIKEQANRDIIESDFGFVTYLYLKNNQVYIVDIYVLPEKRRSKYASRLADAVCDEARLKGCTHVLGSADTRSPTFENSLKTLEGYGMKVYKVENSMVYYIKELKKEEV